MWVGVEVLARFTVEGVSDAVKALKTLLGSRRPCLVALDIDGTITEERSHDNFRVDAGVIEGIRVLEDLGVVTLFVTGNSVPVVAGFARYIGSTGPQVAENGCVVFYEGVLWRVCRGTARAAARIVEEEFSGIVVPSWQNYCRLHDYAFAVKRGFDPSEVAESISRLLAERNVRAKISNSGYAIHIRPPDASKASGLEFAARLLGHSRDCVVAVGDSSIDAEMRSATRVLVAVGNADRELVKEADIVVGMSSGQATRIVLKAIAGIVREQA